MIEMTYKGNAKENKNQDSQITPKNIRQIGEVGRERKVYLEDYAVTYMQQVSAAILLGEIRTSGNTQLIFVNAAVEADNMESGGIDWEKLYREVKEQFGEREIIGYYRKMDEEPMEITEEIGELFRSCFSDENRVLVLHDTAENEEVVFLMENGLLKKQPGYYIYYEKNPKMQEYMVSKNEGKSVEKETVVTDKAIKNFRKIIGEKQEEKGQEPKPKTPRFLYAASTFLVLVIAVIGVTIMNNNDKMNRVETTLANISKQTGDQKETGTTEAAKQIKETQQARETDVLSRQTEQVTQANTEASGEVMTESVQQTENQQTALADETDRNQGIPQTEASGTNSTEADPANTVPVVSQASYIVKAGDTLANICRMYYGNVDNLDEICRINGIQDPNTIIMGQKIVLP